MKKMYSLLATLLFLHCAFATTHEVQVSNFQFSPSSLNVNVGDTIKWVWVSGTHTTTSETIPPGADAWNSAMDATTTSFIYKITVAGTYDYKCIPHAAFGMIATITASGALPVTLSSFTISPTKTNNALVAWATATEQNTDHFEIMRSTNGSSFTKIASVPAKGNSAVLVNYAYTDNTLPAGSRFLYYSLTIVDKDGRKTYSDIKMFRSANGNTPKLIVSLSPNPISRPGHLMLQFNSEKENTMHVQLFDPSGKLVKQADMAAVAGLNNGHFHIGDVAPGTYTILFTMDALKESYKVLVQ